MESKYKVVITAAVLVFLCSTLFFFKANPAHAITSAWIDEKELGEMCISQVASVSKESAAKKSHEILSEKENNKDVIGKNKVENESADKDKNEAEEESKEKEETVTVSGDPLVIIYHTHSSESYMPYKESNYHREAEEGTVRDVGSVLTDELKKKGINVIHNKTIHDRPSYNESYDRSLATIQSLVKKYPSAVYIIDLHRDAAAASATEGKYFELNGKRVAKFSIVVGKANENYVELYGFAKGICRTAERMYPGYGGHIIEKNYNYNEYISNKCLLLEMGNNKNTIEETRLSAKYFAEVLYSVIKSEQ